MKILILLVFISSTSFSYDKWYKGSVDKAFSEASKQNKPLFLYWGAVWCPPCNQMKKTVFSTDKFAKVMENFIPVYLDGDTKKAQIWADKLGARGYPTMLVMNSKGQELMRMPTGLDSQKYLDLLIQSTATDQKIHELSEMAINSKLDKLQWEILANYSWGQSTDDHPELILRKLWTIAPTKELQAKLLLNLLSISPKEVFDNKMEPIINFVLTSSVQVKENLELICWSLPKYIKSSIKDPKASVFKSRLLTGIEIAQKLDLTEGQKLISLYPSVIFSQKDIAKKVADQVKLVDKSSNDSYSRQSNMSDAIYLLIETNQFKLAREYTLKEIGISKSGFYFMSYLAMIAEKENNKVEAITWYKKAWKSAVGEAASFQWGTNYLLKLMELSPKDDKRITSDMNKILSKVLTQEDAFNGRNMKRMQKLSTKYKEWKVGHKLKDYDYCKKALNKKDCSKFF